MNHNEYEWVKQTHQILLDQCRDIQEDELTKVFEFGFQSIRDSLVHVAGCYHAWLGSFVLSEVSSPLITKEVIETMDIEDIQHYFNQADLYVDRVFEQFTGKIDETIEKELSWKMNSGLVRKKPQQLLVHSITHEFHHKGQIVAMLRLLGYTPENTDILGLN